MQNLWLLAPALPSLSRSKPMVKGPQHDGDRLGALLRRANVSHAALAAAADVSVQAVGKWIRTGKFAREHVPTICRTLHCSADELLGLSPVASTSSETASLNVREMPATSGPVVQRDLFREAAVITAEGLGRGLSRRTPDAIGDLVLAVHDMLAQNVERDQVLRIVRSAS